MARRTYRNLGHFFQTTGLTQAWLAKELGVTQSCISLIVSRKRAPKYALAQRIAKVARIPLISLYTSR